MDTRQTIEVNITESSSCYAGVPSSKTKQILTSQTSSPTTWETYKMVGREEGNIKGLLNGGMTIQQWLRADKGGMAIVKILLKFKNIMSKGDVNGALKLITDNIYSGILPLNKEALELLVQKHPQPSKPPDILIQGPTRPIHPVTYDGMNVSIIIKVSMLTRVGPGYQVSMQMVGAEI